MKQLGISENCPPYV